MIDERRLQARDLLEDALDARLRQQIERRVADAEPIAAALDLVLGLLARCVEHGADRAREVRRRLQQQRRLADAGLAAQQHQRARNDATAEHAIELADPGRQPHGVARFRPLRTAVASDAARCAYRLAAGDAASARPARSSANEFQAPHSVQRPSHLGDCAPHSWQTKTTLVASWTQARWQVARLTSLAVHVTLPGHSIRSRACHLHSYADALVPSRHTISHGIVPIGGGHLARVDPLPASSPCRPRMHHLVARLARRRRR